MTWGAGREGSLGGNPLPGTETSANAIGWSKARSTKIVILFAAFWLGGCDGDAAEGHGRWLLC